MPKLTVIEIIHSTAYTVNGGYEGTESFLRKLERIIAQKYYRKNKKDSDDPKHWFVDLEAVQVVKRIFILCMEGRGLFQIAKVLTAEKKHNLTVYKMK